MLSLLIAGLLLLFRSYLQEFLKQMRELDLLLIHNNEWPAPVTSRFLIRLLSIYHQVFPEKIHLHDQPLVYNNRVHFDQIF